MWQALLKVLLDLTIKLVDPLLGYQLGVNRLKRQMLEHQLEKRDEMDQARNAAPRNHEQLIGRLRNNTF